MIKRFENRSINESNDRNKHMHQTVLSIKKINLHILQKLNDTKKNFTKEISNSKLSLFDRVKTVNQKNRKCTEIRKVLQENKKSYDEVLLKKFKLIENILLFKEKLWVFDFDQLKLNIIRKIHEKFVSEHSNVRRTCKYLHK